MRMVKLTSKFQLAIADAQSLALGRDHQYIEAVHVLLALLNQQTGSLRPILADLEVDISLLRSQLEAELERRPAQRRSKTGHQEQQIRRCNPTQILHPVTK